MKIVIHLRYNVVILNYASLQASVLMLFFIRYTNYTINIKYERKSNGITLMIKM